MKYPVSFASYPTSFKGYIISPTKICLQFNDTQIKLRLHNEDKVRYMKTGINNDRCLPVFTLGTNIDCLAVGCQIPVLETYQLALIEAYKKYWDLYRKTYKETYKKEFSDFIRTLEAQLTNLLNEIKIKETEDINGH